MEFLSESFRWLNDVFLKMSWLSDGVAVFVERIIGLPLHARTGASVHFFIYDTCKIFILLGALIYTLSFVQSYFPPERTRYLLGKMNGFKANVVGALLGTVTPFCSCSSIPLFIGFVRAGLPVGVTFSFLISSPLVDLASIILLASIFNWQIALVYVLLGLILAVVGGSLISALRMDRYVADFIKNSKGHVESFQAEDFVMTRRERHAFALGQVKDIVRRVWLYVVLGVAIGAVIHNWLPESLIHAVMGREHWYSVPLATLVGIPMYADIFGTLPIAEALVTRGVGLGTVLAFMMAVTALSLPSLLLLKQVIMPRLMAAFVVIVFMGILLIGTGLNIFFWMDLLRWEKNMKIKVMGTGCKKCKQLFENVQQAAANMGMQAEVEYVTDMAEIVSQGIMTTPALIMEGRTVSAGKLLTVKEIETLLS